jgi:hypothetical protein
MTLEKILKEIELNKPQADMDVQLGSPQTYSGRVGLKRAATEAIKRLKIDYRNQLMDSSVFIVVTGAGKDTFAQLASNEAFGCFSLDPEDFYKDLVSRINPSLFGREGARQLFNIVENILENKALELDMLSYYPLSFNDKYNSAVNSADDLVPLVKRAINDQVGSEIVGINAIHSVVEKAITKNHSAPVTPIIFNTSDETFALDLYKNLSNLVDRNKYRTESEYKNAKKNKTFLVLAGKSSKNLHSTEGAILVKNVNEENVDLALSTIRSKVL